MTLNHRTVTDNVLHSDRLPAVRISVHPDFAYAGSLRFILNAVAHVEQHHFVIADERRRVRRLVWVQFEGYLDDNAHTYHYPMTDTLTLGAPAGAPGGAHTFLHDAGVLNIDDDYRERPASDSAHVVDFLRGQGYGYDGDTLFKRLVWLDAAKRNELMIIYAEDLRPTGYRVPDLQPGGSAAAHWPALAQALHRRALASFTIA